VQITAVARPRNHEDPTHSQNSAATNGGCTPAQLIILEYLHYLAASNFEVAFLRPKLLSLWMEA